MNTQFAFDPSQQNTLRGVKNHDRRRNGRIYYSASAVIENLDSTPLNSAMVINYSNGGLCFESDALITPGTIIYLGISDSPYSHAATTYECHRVKVMWCKDLYRSDYKYGYGVRHLDPIDAYTDDIGEQLYDIPKYLKMVMAAKKDCRRHPRKAASNKVFFTSANQFHEGTITDVSKGGFFIATPDNFVVGQTVNLVVPGTKFDKGVMIKAEIVRTTPAGIGAKIIGLIKKMA